MKRDYDYWFASGDISARPLRTSISHLKEEYEAWQSLLDAQPALIEHFFAMQARALAEAITARAPRAQFAFPEEVVVELLQNGRGEIGYVPAESREHMIGRILEQITHGQVGVAVRRPAAPCDGHTHGAQHASRRPFRHLHG